MVEVMLIIILSPFAIICGMISVMIIYAVLKKMTRSIFNKNKKEDNKC